MEVPVFCPPLKDAPASPRGREYITLHLYRASGELVVADRVSLDQNMVNYVQDLEEGLIEGFGIRWDDGVEGHGARVWEDMVWEDIEGPRYARVWKDMVLEGRRFVGFVDDHGMPIDDPVEIMVVMQSSQRAAVDIC